MLIEDWRPKLYCKGIACDNISPNEKVFFLEEGHKYMNAEDIVDGKLKSFNESKFKYRSPTGIIKDLHEEFDTIPQAQKYVKKHKLPITWQQLVYAWESLADFATNEGTILHAYGESLWNGWEMPRPDLHKTPLLENMTKYLQNHYKLAKTEILVYSNTLRLAGQADLLLKNHDGSEYYIMDYKFLKDPIEYKSFYSRYGANKGYKFMKGPFHKLMDCNHNHYSIQMEIYRYLMGPLGKKVKKKTLLVVTKEGYELVEGKPMKIWVDKNGILQARYRHYKNKLYDSSCDPEYLANGYKIINI